MAASYRSHPLYWWFYAAMSYMSVVIISILFIWHLVNFVSDFCTKSRRSVRWRKKPPAITKLYSALSITALLAIALFVTGNVLHAFIALSEYSDKCVRVIKSMSTTYCFGKASMYLNFILRVHLVYSDTQYAYKTRYLCIFALLSVLGALVAAVLNEYFVYADSVLYEHAAMSHALHCDTWIPWFSVVIFGSFDALVQLGYLYAFANPLRLMIKAQQAESVSNTNLWSMGTKSFILSLVATVTTVGFMSSLLIMNSIFFGGSDGVINSICIMMMTPYYNAKYYNKMCCLMIRGMQHFAKKHGAEPQLQVAVTNATNLEKTASTDGTNSKPTLTTTMFAIDHQLKTKKRKGQSQLIERGKKQKKQMQAMEEMAKTSTTLRNNKKEKHMVNRDIIALLNDINVTSKLGSKQQGDLLVQRQTKGNQRTIQRHKQTKNKMIRNKKKQNKKTVFASMDIRYKHQRNKNTKYEAEMKTNFFYMDFEGTEKRKAKQKKKRPNKQETEQNIPQK